MIAKAKNKELIKYKEWNKFFLINKVLSSVVGIWVMEDFESGVLSAKIVEKEQKILEKFIY